MSDIDDQISKIYYSPTSGYQSEQKLYKTLHEKGLNVTYKQIRNFLNNQYTSQVNKQYRKPLKHKFSKIMGFAPNNIYQVDIMVYNRYEYNNYKYILCCIDVYSRFAQCRAMTNRNMKTIMKHFKSIIDVMGVPKNINADNEFNKAEFKHYCKDNDIKTWFSQPDEINKNSLIERFHRTLALLLQRWRTATGKYSWYKVLPDIVENYNDTYHNSIKSTPYDVFNYKSVNYGELTNHKQIRKTFEIGDKVRILMNKDTFDKGDEIRYSKQVYTVVGIDKQKYELVNDETNHLVRRKFKYYELLKINQPKQIPEDIEEQIHLQQKREKKINRENEKAGVEHENIIHSTRKRKPKQTFEIVEEEVKQRKVKPKYEIEKLLKKKNIKGKEYFIVKWKGYTEPTYEPTSNLIKYVPHLVVNFDK